MPSVKINPARLHLHHKAIAAIGATGRGGVDRQALTQPDIEARMLIFDWAADRGFECRMDAIGNMFVTRPGRYADRSAVLTGSHLDTQPTGGNFDGIFGVLAALEVLESLEDQELSTLRPVQLVVWTNEEGARFQPTTMGSAVFAGALSLDEALKATDREGISVAVALEEMWRRMPQIPRSPHVETPFAYVEAHIEQGPVLENAGDIIGIVTGIQGLRSFEIEISGNEGHAGTTPMRGRADAFVAAVVLVNQLQSACSDPTDTLRFTIGRFDVAPGSPNTIPSQVRFMVDVRHPDDRILREIGDRIIALCSGAHGPCRTAVTELLYSHPVSFNPNIQSIIRYKASARGYGHLDLFSGATHDAKFLADICPSGMLFIPCWRGISHSEEEMAFEEHITAGAEVLADTIVDLANSGASFV